MVSRLSVLCWENHTQHRKVQTPLSQLRAPLPHSRVPQRQLSILRHTTRHPPLHIPLPINRLCQRTLSNHLHQLLPICPALWPHPAPGGGAIDISSHAPCVRAPVGTAATVPPTAHLHLCSHALMPIKKRKNISTHIIQLPNAHTHL
jgi:hypothetical protein